MNNKLSDLNNILFAELEALQADGHFEKEDGSLDMQAYEAAFKRADKVCHISSQIIDLHRLQLDAVKKADDMGIVMNLPDTLGLTEDRE